MLRFSINLSLCVCTCHLFAQTPTPHSGWQIVPGGDNLIKSGYWATVYESGNAFQVPDTSIAVKNGALVAAAGSGYLGGPNVLAPRLHTTGDFGVIATIQTGNGSGGLISLTGSFATGDAYWKGLMEFDFGVDGSGNYIADYWNGTQSSPIFFQTLKSAPASGPPAGVVTMELLHQGGQFLLYFDGVQYGPIPDPGLFKSGYVTPGFVLGPKLQLHMTQFAFETPRGNSTAQLMNPVGAIPFVHPGDSLRSLAADAGKLFGVQVTAEQLSLGRYQPSDPGAAPDPTYAPKVIGEFNQITAAEMYWFLTGPVQGAFIYDNGDALLADAKANGLPVHCHHLIGPNLYLPDWLVKGTFTKAQLTAIMQDHIQNVVTHFKGQCASWDVVNEALDQNGQPSTSGNIWAQVIGSPEYIDLAFKQVHQLDPSAKLYYNDYQDENLTGTKAAGVYNLVAGMQQRGVPIDGVGLQAHWIVGNSFWLPDHDSMVANMAQYAKLGLNARISELDARMQLPATPDLLAAQANIFATTIQACLDSPNCVSITVWGANDKTSWIPYFFPGFGAATFFDASFQPKPGYTSAMNTLRTAALASKTAPTLSSVAVVNAASYAKGGIAPGELVTLFPSNSGPATQAGASLDSTGKVATETGQTRVLFDGIAAPMIYSLKNQAAAVVPYEVAGHASTLVQVEYNGLQSVAAPVPVVQAIPGVFTADGSGTGQAAMLNADGTANSPSNPASRGTVAVLFVTGEGQTNPAGTDGVLDSSPGPAPLLPVVVTVGSTNATTDYAAGAPGFIGLMQINFHVPANIQPSNTVPVQVQVGATPSNIVTMAIK